MISTIMDSKEKVTLISIAPLTNVARALIREPRIAKKARFVGMHGSIAKKFDGVYGVVPEYNVVIDVQSAKAVF